MFVLRYGNVRTKCYLHSACVVVLNYVLKPELWLFKAAPKRFSLYGFALRLSYSFPALPLSANNLSLF